jgi:hypothetical protein
LRFGGRAGHGKSEEEKHAGQARAQPSLHSPVPLYPKGKFPLFHTAMSI